jgi:hypothetical protein
MLKSMMINNVPGLSQLHNAYVSTANVFICYYFKIIYQVQKLSEKFTLHNLAIWTTLMKSYYMHQGQPGADDSCHSLLQKTVLTEREDSSA